METAAEQPALGVGTMIAEALRAKSLELGEEYSYRDLERDTGVTYSYVSKVVNGKANPSRKVLRKWARALHPYLHLDAALAMGGYLPDDPEKAAVMQEMANWTREEWRSFMERLRQSPERRARMVLLEGQPPKQVAEDEAEYEAGENQPDP